MGSTGASRLGLGRVADDPPQKHASSISEFGRSGSNGIGIRMDPQKFGTLHGVRHLRLDGTWMTPK